jgi:hypothetical protein
MNVHSAEDVFEGKGSVMPDGSWISPCGEFESIVHAEHGIHSIGRNHCHCRFCEGLRARWRSAS